VSSRIATELILDMLQSFGVALDEPLLIFGEKVRGVMNNTVPSSVLKKKHNEIIYHQFIEAFAARIMRFSYIKSEENVSDVLKKPLNNKKFHYLMMRWLFCAP
jgi:hypothetical protein